jgi:hypothetical protein
MTVIYARTNLPSRCGRGFKNQKNVIRVTNRYTNAGPWHGVVPVKNRPIMIIGSSDTPELKLSTNLLKFIPRGETKELGITTNKSWRIV